MRSAKLLKIKKLQKKHDENIGLKVEYILGQKISFGDNLKSRSRKIVED